MSKIVTIPTWSNPFTVSINDTDYTYPAGATLSVPDEVAAAIEAATRKKPFVPVEAPFEGDGSPNAVLYTAQTLTDEQKAQARENIGAVTLDEVMDSLYDAEEVAY